MRRMRGDGLPRVCGSLGLDWDGQGGRRHAFCMWRSQKLTWLEVARQQASQTAPDACDAAARALLPGPWLAACSSEILRSFTRLFDATLERRKLTPDAD